MGNVSDCFGRHKDNIKSHDEFEVSIVDLNSFPKFKNSFGENSVSTHQKKRREKKNDFLLSENQSEDPDSPLESLELKSDPEAFFDNKGEHQRQVDLQSTRELTKN